ncbi:MAG: GNAT family N-acetyltransferase [Lachnospiraceae bacterium]|nr:GNAT family N-acetyltransferase [Lachnospiraceae bacterium]
MNIRRATAEDIPGLNKLLYQVLMVHHNGRPDLFKPNVKKYTDQELEELLKEERRPVFAAVDEKNQVLGYAFCILEEYTGDNTHPDMKTLYIDDLCVDEEVRGQHIGETLYEYVLDYAGKIGCYNVTLNVWSCNPGAMKFYEKCGLVPYKVGMEKVL